MKLTLESNNDPAVISMWRHAACCSSPNMTHTLKLCLQQRLLYLDIYKSIRCTVYMHVSNPCVHIVWICGEMLGVQRFEGEYLVEMSWYDTVHFNAAHCKDRRRRGSFSGPTTKSLIYNTCPCPQNEIHLKQF